MYQSSLPGYYYTAQAVLSVYLKFAKPLTVGNHTSAVAVDWTGKKEGGIVGKDQRTRHNVALTAWLWKILLHLAPVVSLSLKQPLPQSVSP